ncbi:MAG: PilW family protein, partial [Betaproteobacteria bacterium]
RRCKKGTDPCSPQDWNNVIAVRLRVLSRSLGRSPGYVDAKVYDMGLAGVIPPFNDAYKRHLFGVAVTAYNLAGQREP